LGRYSGCRQDGHSWSWQHITGVDIDVGAQRLQAFKEQIDRARADGATAGKRHFRFAMRASSGPITQNDARIFDTSS